MSPDTRESGAARAAAQIGPGILVLIVGPSGAGKDTLIALAQKALGEDARYLFVRRVVTRPAGAYEDHASLSEEAFEAAERAGEFAMTWRAHELRYGLPVAIEAAAERGQIIVANVSRTVIGELRTRYRHVLVILVTAPPEILGQRLAARGRGKSLAARLERGQNPRLDAKGDVVIENVGNASIGSAALIETLKALTPGQPPGIFGAASN